MSPNPTPIASPAPPRGVLSRSLRHHAALVGVLLVIGAGAGWAYSSNLPVAWTSTTRVLINPSVGNPFSATPSSVRQDELTSLETEAQMVRSSEVLDDVVAQSTGLTASLASHLQVTIPPSTQILQISYTAQDPVLARQVAEVVATSYLDNRASRFEQVKDDRVARLESQTARVVDDLRDATTAAQRGTQAQRAFNSELANALRNELVNLRSQRTTLENLTSPAGAVISPASRAVGPSLVTGLVWPVGGGVAGALLGMLIALLLERVRGVVRSAAEAREAGLAVVAAATPSPWRLRKDESARRDAVDSAVRRLRANIMDMPDRPEIISIAGTTNDSTGADAAEALAGSFTRAGHRVVLVRPDRHSVIDDVAVDEKGLAQLLLHERLDVHDLLRPSLDPLLTILDGGSSSSQSHELLTVDRVRSVLRPLVEEGHLVVIQVPEPDSVEGEALMRAADLGIIVVATSQTRRRTLDLAVANAHASPAQVVGVVVGAGDLDHRTRPIREVDQDASDGDDNVARPAAKGTKTGSSSADTPSDKVDQSSSSSGSTRSTPAGQTSKSGQASTSRQPDTSGSQDATDVNESKRNR